MYKIVPQPCEGEQLLLSRLTGPETESEGHPHPTTPVGRLQQRSAPPPQSVGSSKQTNPKNPPHHPPSHPHIPSCKQTALANPEADDSLLTTAPHDRYVPQQQ